MYDTSPVQVLECGVYKKLEWVLVLVVPCGKKMAKKALEPCSTQNHRDHLSFFVEFVG